MGKLEGGGAMGPYSRIGSKRAVGRTKPPIYRVA